MNLIFLLEQAFLYYQLKMSVFIPFVGENYSKSHKICLVSQIKTNPNFILVNILI